MTDKHVKGFSFNFYFLKTVNFENPPTWQRLVNFILLLIVMWLGLVCFRVFPKQTAQNMRISVFIRKQQLSKIRQRKQ